MQREWRRGLTAATLLVFSGITTSCTGVGKAQVSEPTTSPTTEVPRSPCDPAQSPVLCMEWSVATGTLVTATTGGVIETSATTCAEWAQGSDLLEGDLLQLPLEPEPTEGPPVSLLQGIIGYDGPRSYDLRAVNAFGGPAVVIVDLVDYIASDESAGAISVNEDGSGEFRFANLQRFTEQAAGAAPGSTEPDSTEPDSTEPDSTEPDAPEPDAPEASEAAPAESISGSATWRCIDPD